jgi:hypothetical protein
MASDAAFENILTSPIQPEHRAKPAVMSPSELYRQLRLAYPAKAM